MTEPHEAPSFVLPAEMSNGATPLTHLGVIRAQGPDAASFLHGQLSQDFALLGHDNARLAAYCSAKGRMLASFIGFRKGEDTVLLVCSRDLLPQTLKRLSMFVLRAKVKLGDASDEWQLWGLTGDAIKNIAGCALPTWGKVDFGTQTMIGLHPALGIPRALWVSAAASPAPAAVVLPADLWAWSEVRAGVATLPARLIDAFVPQMLNYESVGGISFKKGCYPGQEVVARSQFRGTLKRRAYVVHAAQALAPGDEIFHSSDPEQPCGQVVQAAPAPGGGWDALVSMQTAAALEGTLASAGGAALTLLPLPYPLLEDI